jgi:hypothetical protein
MQDRKGNLCAHYFVKNENPIGTNATRNSTATDRGKIFMKIRQYPALARNQLCIPLTGK